MYSGVFRTLNEFSSLGTESNSSAFLSIFHMSHSGNSCESTPLPEVVLLTKVTFQRAIAKSPARHAQGLIWISWSFYGQFIPKPWLSICGHSSVLNSRAVLQETVSQRFHFLLKYIHNIQNELLSQVTGASESLEMEFSVFWVLTVIPKASIPWKNQLLSNFLHEPQVFSH